MKTLLHRAVRLALLVVILSAVAGAQDRQMRIDPSSNMMLLEIGAIVSADGDALT